MEERVVIVEIVLVDFLEFDEVFFVSVEFLLLEQVMSELAFEVELVFLN